MKNTRSAWLYEITPKRKFIDINFREIWRYRDLVFLFVKRNIATTYKQTILGPLWFLIQPLFTSVIFTLVFNDIASISTGKAPSFLFNLTGITAWNYFSQCLAGTSNTFRANAGIFGKVYFPRVIMPLSTTVSNLVKLGIQLIILVIFYLYFLYTGYDISPNTTLLLFPVYVVIMAMMGLGLGMTISAFTTKYRDLSVLLGFATSLLLYISAVPYPLSQVTEKLPEYDWVVKYNPLTQVIEGFRYMVLDQGSFSWLGFWYAFISAFLLFFVGLIFFNQTEKTFIDTV